MILERHIATFFDHIAIDESGHWLWTGFRTHGGNGYGQFSGKPNTNAFLAHRFAYELMVGPIPEGLQIDHLCRIKNCVNPDHLEAVTPRENVRRHYAALEPATHCIRGHEYTLATVYEFRGKRYCRTCRNEYMRRYLAANPEQLEKARERARIRGKRRAAKAVA